jgi:hypothetical protein
MEAIKEVAIKGFYAETNYLERVSMKIWLRMILKG